MDDYEEKYYILYSAFHNKNIFQYIISFLYWFYPLSIWYIKKNYLISFDYVSERYKTQTMNK